MATSSNLFGENATKVPMVLDTLTGQIRPLAPGEQISARFVEAPKFLNPGQVPPTIQLQKDYVELYQRMVELERKYCECTGEPVIVPCPEPEPCEECPPAVELFPSLRWLGNVPTVYNGEAGLFVEIGAALDRGDLVADAEQSGVLSGVDINMMSRAIFIFKVSDEILDGITADSSNGIYTVTFDWTGDSEFSNAPDYAWDPVTGLGAVAVWTFGGRGELDINLLKFIPETEDQVLIGQLKLLIAENMPGYTGATWVAWSRS